ncbi:MAG: alpha/beta hydrolase [Puniceicoccales bacterium]|nr:alpha/beta hydrolase [Puniceicoccales bacterium]
MARKKQSFVPWWRRGLAWRLLRVFAMGCAGALVVGCLVADRLIFPVPEASYPGEMAGLVWLPLRTGGEVPAIWRPRADARWTVVYFHGNAMDLGHCNPMVNYLHRSLKCAVLCVEYPGYGPAGGSPSEEGCYAAADSAYDYLRTVRGVPAEQIALYGYSLGTGVAADLAARVPAGALILEAPFLSTFRVVTRVKIVPFDRFDNLSKIDGVRCPLLVIHGTADKVVPFAHGQALFAAAKNARRKQFLAIEGGAHVELRSRAPERFDETLAGFLSASE